MNDKNKTPNALNASPAAKPETSKGYHDSPLARKKDPQKMTEEEKRAELCTIKKQLNSLQSEVEEKETKATKILHGVLWRVKEIGDLLARAKKLLPHGAYKKWVKKNFNGSWPTAKHYKWLAEKKQWNQIKPLLKKGDLSIREADAILHPKDDGDDERAVPVDPDFHEFEKMARKLFADAIPQTATWTDEDLFVLQEHFIWGREYDLLHDLFSEALKWVCARLQSRVRTFAAYHIGVDEKKLAKHLAWRAEERKKEEAEDYIGPAVFEYTKPSSRCRDAQGVVLRDEGEVVYFPPLLKDFQPAPARV